jgi:hypothetical protein
VRHPGSVSPEGDKGYSLDGYPSRLEKSLCLLYKSPNMDNTRAGSEKASSVGSTCFGGTSKNALSFLHDPVPNRIANMVIDNIFFI